MPPKECLLRYPSTAAILACAWLAVAATAQSQTFVRSWGRFGTAPGRFDFTGSCGVAIASDGKVFVTDTGNHRVQVFLPDSTFLYQWGSHGTAPGQFGGVGGIALDAVGNLYVADTQGGPEIGSRVQKFTKDGSFVAQWPTDPTGLEPTNSLTGIAIDALGYVFVGDVRNGCVKKFSPDGVLMAKWGSKAAYPTPGPNSFWGLSGVAVDDHGYVQVADAAYNYVQTFSGAGQYLATWGSGGTGGNGTFPLGGGPYSIASDLSGHLYAGDDKEVQVFSDAGTFISQWGSNGSAVGQFANAAAIAISNDGLVYVVDAPNNRIEVFTSPVTPTRTTTWGQLKASYR